MMFGAGKKVIVIDDEEDLREGIRQTLSGYGFHVDIAANGSIAFEMLKKQHYDLALVDLKLPGIDGFQVTEFINNRFGNKTVVIIISALATVEAAVEVTSRGAFAFLVKPFTTQDLLRVVKRGVKQSTLIEEHDRSLTELNSEQNRSRQLINSMWEGVVVINLNRKVVLMNPRAEYYLAVRYKKELPLNKAGFCPTVIEVIDQIFSGETEPGKVILRQNCQGPMLEVMITPYIRDNQMAGLIINLRDITEEIKIELDKKRFISMVAHELGSPLSAIVNYINIIQTGMFNDKPLKRREILERCKIRGEALLDLINDLQYLNKRDTINAKKSIEKVDLCAVITEQLEFLKGQAERLHITTVLKKDKGQYFVFADRGDLDRIFINLISNGIKYNTERGNLAITISRKDNKVIIGLTDTGIGISEKEMKNLFKEFYRVKNRKTSGIAGTGLGLATVKRVLSEYGGLISVKSIADKGSTFTVELPEA